jgi:hypothetical protein
MIICMRTTLVIADSLAEEAKQRAAAQGRTFTSLVEEGLRMVLAEPATPSEHTPLPVWAGGGRQLVDLEDKDALWDVLDEDVEA